MESNEFKEILMNKVGEQYRKTFQEEDTPDPPLIRKKSSFGNGKTH